MLGSAIYRTAKQLKLLMRRNIIVYYLQAAGVSCAKSIAGWHCWERSCKHSTRNKKKLDASLSSFGYPPPPPPPPLITHLSISCSELHDPLNGRCLDSLLLSPFLHTFSVPYHTIISSEQFVWYFRMHTDTCINLRLVRYTNCRKRLTGCIK